MKIFLPRPRPPGDFHHAGNGGFRWIVAEWGRLGLAEIVPTDSPFVWVERVGGVLLYDRPTLEWLPENVDYWMGLFANCDPPCNGHNNRSWTFFPRHPALVQAYRKTRLLGYRERKYKCSFMGGYENRIQRGYRSLDYWRGCCDLFASFGSTDGRAAQPYTPAEYLRLLRQSRFGLCLRGYGPKCQREIECLAMGCVPIITPGVSLEYRDPLLPEKHCLQADTELSVHWLIDMMASKAWEDVSWNGQKWYERNCTPEGSFALTKSILEESHF